MKKCLVCKDTKNERDFYKSHKGDKFTRASYCKYCQNIFAKNWREQNKDRMKKYKVLRYKMLSTPNKRRNNHYMSRYGITIKEYEEMLLVQDGVCKICLHPCRRKSVLSIDHCHKTGQVRGLLCDACNNMLGRAGDDANILRRAVEYLDFFEAVDE